MKRRVPGQRPARVLLTGFGPFPGMPDNPSARIVARLSAERMLARNPRVRLTTRVLPTTWAALPGLAALVRNTRPDIVVMVGVHGRAYAVRIEVSGWNEAGRIPDAVGALPNNSPLDGAGPVVRHPATAWAARIAGAGHASKKPVAVSRNAGRYLCNAALYTALGVRVPGQGSGTRVFVHIPPPRLAPGVTETAIADAVRGIVLSAPADPGRADPRKT